jgi:hypothetical protein
MPQNIRWVYAGEVKAGLAFLVISASFALAQPSHLPRFEDYPVKEIFSGTPARPILNTLGKNVPHTHSAWHIR